MTNTRRSFLQRLSSLPLLGAWFPVHAASAPTGRYLMNRFRIAGLPYYQAKTILRSLRPGMALRLVAEPENPHDEFAVEMFLGEVKLGYVPRSDNRHISRLLRQGATVVAEVTEVAPEGSIWEVIRAEVFLVV